MNHSVKSLIFPVKSSIIGAAAVCAVVASVDNASFTLFIATVALSIGSNVPLYVSSTTVPYSDMDAESSSILIRPSLIAVVISAAPFVPNNSIAICIASVSVFALLMPPIVSSRATSIDFPSFAAFCNAFFKPASAVVVSTPFASN